MVNDYDLMTDEEIKAALGRSPDLFATFLKCVAEPSIQDQFVEALAEAHPYLRLEELRDMLMRAIDRVYPTEYALPGRRFDLRVVIREAPAFEFLVRYARRIAATRTHVFPDALIPCPDHVVKLLNLFRVQKGLSSSPALQEAS